jgi:hypothetical protein
MHESPSRARNGHVKTLTCIYATGSTPCANAQGARSLHDAGFIQFSSGTTPAGFMLGYRFACKEPLADDLPRCVLALVLSAACWPMPRLRRGLPACTT